MKREKFLEKSGLQSVSNYRAKIAGERKALEKIEKNEVPPLCRQMGLPLFSEQIEAIIEATTGEPLSETSLQKAILSALYTPLRQSVGSCFATAPAILIQEAFPEQFLEDITSLLQTGELARTFGGETYSVPFCLSPGIGDLKRPFSASAHLSPGLLAGLEAAGLIDPALSFEDKLAEQKKLIKKAETPLSLYETLLRKKHGLSLQDFEEAKKEQKMAIKREIVTGFTSKIRERERYEKDLKAARFAFIGFTENLLLKCWEYTLASFCDSKQEFSRYNLYLSLGLHPEQKGGIGALIYDRLQSRLEEDQEQVEKYQKEVEIAAEQVRATEYLLGTASGEREIRRLKAEHTSRLHHLQSCQDLLHKHHKGAEQWAGFHQFLHEAFARLFPRFFQEVYDPEMLNVQGSIYDDSPAGFRLLFKQGRSWHKIEGEAEWIEAMSNGFTLMEGELIHECPFEAGKAEIVPIITAVIQHLGSDEFLKQAYKRLGPERKPWAYISGGTVDTLVRTYFKRESPLTQETRKVQSPFDLCSFILETLKNLAPEEIDEANRLLIVSPTHAFTLLLKNPFFRKGWHYRGFTYTWIRDEVVNPQKRYWNEILLSSERQAQILEKGPFSAKPSKSTLSLPAFRSYLLQNRPNSYLIDSFLYESFPDKPEPFIIADSNWPDWLFAFVVNPGTNDLEFWRVDQKGRGSPMEEWVHHLEGPMEKTWAIYTRPSEYRSN